MSKQTSAKDGKLTVLILILIIILGITLIFTTTYYMRYKAFEQITGKTQAELIDSQQQYIELQNKTMIHFITHSKQDYPNIIKKAQSFFPEIHCNVIGKYCDLNNYRYQFTFDSHQDQKISGYRIFKLDNENSPSKACKNK